MKLPDMWLIKRASAAPAALRYYSKKKIKKKKKFFFFFFFFLELEIVARRRAALARFGGIPATVCVMTLCKVPSLLHAGAEPALIESGQYRGLFSH